MKITDTTEPQAWIFIFNGEELEDEVLGDFEDAKRLRLMVAQFCGLHPSEIEIKKR